MTYGTLHADLAGVRKDEPCKGNDEALIALGLRALLAAIGSKPFHRDHYIPKGGTVLRLRSSERLERLSTDLDLSGLELERSTAEDHRAFAAEIGRGATHILRSLYAKGTADVSVQFDEDSLGKAHEESDPDTITYAVTVSAEDKDACPALLRAAADTRRALASGLLRIEP